MSSNKGDAVQSSIEVPTDGVSIGMVEAMNESYQDDGSFEYGEETRTNSFTVDADVVRKELAQMLNKPRTAYTPYQFAWEFRDQILPVLELHGLEQVYLLFSRFLGSVVTPDVVEIAIAQVIHQTQQDGSFATIMTQYNIGKSCRLVELYGSSFEPVAQLVEAQPDPVDSEPKPVVETSAPKSEVEEQDLFPYTNGQAIRPSGVTTTTLNKARNKNPDTFVEDVHWRRGNPKGEGGRIYWSEAGIEVIRKQFPPVKKRGKKK